MMNGNSNCEIQTNDPIAVCIDPNSEGVFINKHGKVKVPRVRLHCSDGIYEEYSTDEEEEEPAQPIIDPSTLTWLPFLFHYGKDVAFRTLAACDFMGENLAHLFNITSPKYEYLMDEVKQRDEEKKKEDEEERKAEEEFILETLNNQPKASAIKVEGAHATTELQTCSSANADESPKNFDDVSKTPPKEVGSEFDSLTTDNLSV